LLDGPPRRAVAAAATGGARAVVVGAQLPTRHGVKKRRLMSLAVTAPAGGTTAQGGRGSFPSLPHSTSASALPPLSRSASLTGKLERTPSFGASRYFRAVCLRPGTWRPRAVAARCDASAQPPAQLIDRRDSSFASVQSHPLRRRGGGFWTTLARLFGADQAEQAPPQVR